MRCGLGELRYFMYNILWNRWKKSVIMLFGWKKDVSKTKVKSNMYVRAT